MISRIYKKLEKFAGKVVNPKWLQGIDRDLLLNRPKFWSLKLHYILYYALIANSLIAFLVLIFPISSPTQLPNLLITGLVIIPIGETILLFYWLYIQFLLNRERRYGYIRKHNGLLELLSYIVCITLIASGLIVFFLILQFKVKPVIPRTQLAIDIITLDAIQRPSLENSNDYLKALIDYVNSHEFSKLKTQSIFSEKYDGKERSFIFLDRQFFLSKIRNSNYVPAATITDNQSCFVSYNNDKLRKYWQQNIERETRTFVEYDDNNETRDFQCSLLEDLSNKEGVELLEKSDFNHLVQNIRNNKLEEVIEPMLKYAPPGNIHDIPKFYDYIKKDLPSYVKLTPPSIRKSPVILAASVVLPSAIKLYQTFYKFTTFQDILILYYFLVNLISLLLLLFYSTYMVDFIFALVYIFLIVAVLLVAASFSSSISPGRVMLFFYILPTIIVSCLAFSRRKIKRYWRFKVLNLVAFPLAIVVSVLSVLVLMQNKKIFSMDNQEVYNYSSYLAFLSYIPFIPLLKNELIRQLNLPKD